ncbi:MAG: helix-turn-helix transcriptional regulator [Clostridia bacterium]|nr:helix-turn-helix transcriptional regulator [Clostridia bacterium]
MELKSVGKRIRQYRIARNMKQEDLADKTNLSVTYIGMIERGEKSPRLETFVSIVNALGVTSDALLSDVTITGYKIKDSMLSDKLDRLSYEDREMVYDLIDTVLKHKQVN